MALNRELIKLLACPKCKGKLTVVRAGKGLSCSACSVVYPVKDDIPIMLVDQAIPEKEWNDAK